MKAQATVLLKLFWGTYFILASLYCFLAFVPYTYLFVIVNPPYPWLDPFAHYNLALLWTAVAASVVSSWLSGEQRAYRVVALGQSSFALFISFFNPLPHIQNTRIALLWSAVFLLPVLLTCTYELSRRTSVAGREDRCPSIAYSNAALVGFLVGLISVAIPPLHAGIHHVFVLIQRSDLELMFWVLVEHVTLAIVIASIINLLRLFLPRFTRNAFLLGPGVVGLVVFVCLSLGCCFFVQNSLSLHGWAAWLYSVGIAAALILFGLSLLLPVARAAKASAWHRWLPTAAAIGLLVLAVGGSLAIEQDDDWNGILHQIFTLLIWVVFAIGICGMRLSQRQYTVRTILAITIGTCGLYGVLNYSEPVWAGGLGPNKKVILHVMSNYSTQNTSFELVDKMLGNQPGEHCDVACKTLRQYSNMHNATISRDLKLVDELAPSPAPKPDIFLIVIDSLRPDYLGVYNPRIDFTPNIDAFARDSVVMRRAYSDYAGTSLSEPSIWSGALLLHSHYARPFQKVNSLEKLARVDGYQIVLSYDEILRQIIEPSGDIIKLDTDKKLWSSIEFSSSMEQLETVLNRRNPQDRPVLFYTQSMNVHEHANGSNNLPERTSQNWQSRPGLDDRIGYAIHQVDGFFGGFIAYLKFRNLYDQSIIIVTADHGDATGELGRWSHSVIIYPEVMRIPMIVHLPKSMQGRYVYDENRIAALIDITPSLYYLLGHRPLKTSPLIGHPMFVENAEEFQSYPRQDLFLASDALPAYGILAGDGRWMYTTYDSPSRSMLFDLQQDPDAQRNVLTPAIKKEYDDQVLQYFHLLSDFYGYHPTGG